VCVLLLDEVDSLCPRKGAGWLTAHQTRTSAQLLTLLDNANQVRGLVVFATTNRPYALDPAIRRPGRLETEVLFICLYLCLYVYSASQKYGHILLFAIIWIMMC
jgi:SpoVK/Ycf46/Vps4 family AAA+-type ATPase